MKKNDGGLPLPLPKPLSNLTIGDAPKRIRLGDSAKQPLKAIISMSSLLTVNTLLLFTLAGCNNIVTDRYEATALVTYTWQVAYSDKREKFPRKETFGTNSLLNQNGQKPDGAVTGPDDQGLWWPALPPRPTVDDIEAKQQPNETPGAPELLKQVEYNLTYQLGTETVKLPTNHQVYREVAKAYPSRLPLKFTLGVGDASVDRASQK